MDYKEIGTQLGSTVIDFIKLAGNEDKSDERLEHIYNSKLPDVLSTINLSTLNSKSINHIVDGMVNYFIEETTPEKPDAKLVLDQMNEIMGASLHEREVVESARPINGSRCVDIKAS